MIIWRLSPQQPTASSALASVSYVTIFEATMAAIRDQQNTPLWRSRERITMIFMKWRKYYFHDPTAEILQVLYILFHYRILADTLVMVIVLSMKILAISHLSSNQNGHIKYCKMKHLPKSTTLQNLAQCPKNTRSRIVKRRRYIPHTYTSTRYRSKVVLLGVEIPHLFISCAAT